MLTMVSFRKKRTIDERPGSFKKWKKKKILNLQKNELHKTIVFLLNLHIFQKILKKTISFLLKKKRFY